MKDYSSLVTTFETFMQSHMPEGVPDSLYAPMRYINGIGGKRIRPVLLLMAYNQVYDDITPALPAALAVEYFHNFSLMHDDIMDEALLRRGNESVHVRYGRNAAILSGDAMLIRCFELLLEAGRNNNTGALICAEMSAAAISICEGQQMDMDFEKMDAPAEAEYIEMIRRKTAVLLGASLCIGAILGGSSPEVARMLYSFGENIGISFQIRDDMLDTFGPSKTTGKQQGGDILRGKKNFLYVHVYNSMDNMEKEKFMKLYAEASHNCVIDQVVEIYANRQVEKYAEQMQQEYFSKAMQNLEALKFLNTSLLVQFAEDLMGRDR